MFCLFFSRASHDFWTSHVVICCSWVFSFSIGYSWFLSCSCAFCYSWFFLAVHVFLGYSCFLPLIGYSWLLSCLWFCAGFSCIFFKSSWLVGFWLFYLLLMTFYVYFFSKGCSSITFELFMALDPMTGYFRPLDGYFRPLDGYFRPLDFAHAWTNWFCTHEQLLMHEYPYMSSCSWVSFLLHMRHMSSCSWVWWFSE